jgi:hypothetical protein
MSNDYSFSSLPLCADTYARPPEFCRTGSAHPRRWRPIAQGLTGSVILSSSPAGLIGAVAGPIDQNYLFEARQMQALSLAVHIPLV